MFNYLPVVKSIRFDYEAKLLEVRCEGHATECIECARELGKIMLGNRGAWHITAVVGKMPSDYKHPSEMQVEISIRGVERR